MIQVLVGQILWLFCASPLHGFRVNTLIGQSSPLRLNSVFIYSKFKPDLALFSTVEDFIIPRETNIESDGKVWWDKSDIIMFGYNFDIINDIMCIIFLLTDASCKVILLVWRLVCAHCFESWYRVHTTSYIIYKCAI